jgi:hypothetical protein
MEAALEQLSSLDVENGHTLWSIEMRLALLQYHDGIAAQKAYASEIFDSATGLVAVLSHYTSQRNEDQMSLLRFEKKLDLLLALQSRTSGLQTYLRYRLLHKVEVEADHFRTILNVESQSAILDYYETFVALTQRAALEPCPEDFKDLLVGVLQQVASALPDPRLRRTLFLLGAGDQWLVGAWEHAPRSQITGIENDYFDDVEAWRLASEELAFEDISVAPTWKSNEVVSQTIAALQSLADFPDISDEVAITQRLAVNLRGLQLGRAIQSALDEQYASTTGQLQRCRAAAAMHARHLWPTHLIGCRTTAQLDSLVGICRQSQRSPQFVHAALRELGVACPEDFDKSLDLLQTEVAKVIEGVYDVPEATLSPEPPIGTERARSRVALRLTCTVHLDRGEVDDVVRLLARHAAVRRNIGILPIAEAVSQIDRPTVRRLADDLALPIVLDLYVRYISSDLEEDRAYACEDVLAARGVGTPFELGTRIGVEDEALLRYYLRFLAVPDIMESFTVFESTRDLEDERTRVLSLLIGLDPARAAAYEAEAKDITRNQAIQRGVRQVEQSKIYVDLLRLRKVLEAELQDDFVRYMSLPHLPLNESRDNLVEALRIALDRPSSNVLPEIPKDESSVLLVQMVDTAFRELTSNKEHGLDCYLSMRIRHGALSGQLRTPMERQRLITQVSADGVTYESNTIWLDRLSAGDHIDNASRLNDRMNQLSADYDQLVDMLARELVQIRSDEKPLGLFHVTVRQLHVLDLMASVTRDTTFDEFLDALVGLFFVELNGQLARVRTEIEQAVKPAFLEIINSFEMDAFSIADAAIQPSLSGALATARVEVQQALDVVKDWFQLPQIERLHTFSMDELVLIGLQCVKALHVDYHPDLTTAIGEITPILDPLVIFTDIFVILFDNARVHSGSGAPDLHVSITQADKTITIRVENTVSGPIHEDRVNKIEQIRERIESGSYVDSVAKEGGSGLIKLQRIVRSVDETATIQFGFEDNKFWTTVPIRVLLV